MYTMELVEKSIILCRQIDALYLNDMEELSGSLNGELYDSYKEVVLKEKRILNDIEENLKNCMYAK